MGSQLRFPRAILCATLCFSLLAGCSSSDLSDAVITAQNAELLSAQALDASAFLEGMGDLVEEFSAALDSESDATIPCDSGNRETTLFDAAPLGVLSAGDSATFAFQGCVLNSGLFQATLNGALVLTVVETSGAPGGGPYSLSVSASFQNLSVVTLGTTIVVNGAFTRALSTPDGVLLNAVISGDSMSAFVAGGNGAAWSGTVENFRVERQFDLESSAYLWDAAMTISGSALPGRITFDTTLPFTGSGGDPSAGILVITGAEGATATIVALDDINVQILIDLDGGGGTDITINTTWDVLRDE